MRTCATRHRPLAMTGRLVHGLLIASLAAPGVLGAQASSVVVVRHAEKADTSGNSGLTAAGLARAEALQAALADFPLQAIFVSEYPRTAATAAPTADAFHLTPTVIPIQGDKPAYAAATAAAIHAMPSAVRRFPSFATASTGPSSSSSCPRACRRDSCKPGMVPRTHPMRVPAGIRPPRRRDGISTWLVEQTSIYMAMHYKEFLARTSPLTISTMLRFETI
jgi:hypothetical protein